MILMATAMAGCASPAPSRSASLPPVPEAARYEEMTASALVFDPPVTWGEPPLELSRDERAPSAFVSFEGPIITYFWIHTDDWQGSDWGGGWGRFGGSGDNFQRRALMDKVGVSYR